MTTLSTLQNCVIQNMMVAVAQNVPDYTPNKITAEAFYERISPEVQQQYYNESVNVMTRLSNTTTEQWIEYYNHYMPQVFNQMRQHQDQEAINSIFEMLSTIGK